MIELSRVVKTAIREATDPDRGPEFVAKVVALIPEEDYRAALTQALGRLVHVYDNEIRREALRRVLAPVEMRESGTRSIVGETGKTYVSRKQQQQREVYWPAFLSTRIATAAGSKQLGNATVGEVNYYVTYLKSHAEKTIANAAQYAKLSAAMKEHKVDVVRLLSPDVLEKIFE